MKHVETLHGDDLLDAQIEFDELPTPSDDERELRLAKSLALEAALIGEFGIGEAHKALAARRASKSDS